MQPPTYSAVTHQKECVECPRPISSKNDYLLLPYYAAIILVACAF